MRENVDLKRLRTFYLVAKGGGLQHAANSLGLSISAVSIQIRRLEEDLGVALFQRFGRSLVLTQAGENFYENLGPALMAVDTAVKSITSENFARRRVSLGIGNDVAHLIAGNISHFAKSNPNMDIALRVLSSREIISLVMTSEADLGIGFFGRIPGELEREKFVKTGFSIVCSPKHPLARRKTHTVEALSKHRWIMLRQGTVLRQKVEQMFLISGIQPASIIETTSCEASSVFAEAGVGIAVTHTACLGQHFFRCLHPVRVHHDLGHVDFTIIYRKGQAISSSHRALIQSLRQAKYGQEGHKLI